ncbi:unnamed protein product [Bemisia tabaci]|uniref:Uncharacterized protein n=1 Tax=Bemisia tabaci TaxID=7038 RepID=A0A9P0A8A3_BEMTA|nr:unnamed protein product [Bemisia tabaci]
MASRTTLALISSLALIISLPGGGCILSSLLDGLSAAGAQAGTAASDIGQASLDTLATGTKGLHRMVKFGTKTLTEYHTNSLDYLVGGHKRAAKMIDDGIGGLAELGQKIGVQVLPQMVRDTAFTGTKQAGRVGVDLAKSGVNLLNRAATGATGTLKTVLQESAGRVLQALPKTPILTPIIEMPYDMAHSTLDALTEMANDSAQNTHNILDKFRPDVPDDENP